MTDTPGGMRLFVRVEGMSSFCLQLRDNLLPEHYEEIAVKYFNETFVLSREPQELILIRRVHFQTKDILLDFKRKRTTRQRAAAQVSSALTTVKTSGGPGPGESLVTEDHLYDRATSKKIKNELVVTDAMPTVPQCETHHLPLSVSFNRLIALMTDPGVPPFIEDVFFVTYRQFASASEVLTKLIERYDTPPLTKVGEPQRSPLDQQLYLEMTLGVKTKVFRVLERWVSECFFDFADDVVYSKLNDFVREKVDTDSAPPRILQLIREKNRTALQLRGRQQLPGSVNKKLVPSALLTVEPSAIAVQLTILTQLIHSRIEPHELIGGLWNGPQSVHVPNFVAYRDFFARVSNWVTYAVVSEADFGRRVRNLDVLLQTCRELLASRNFDMAMAVYGGLTEPPCERLTQTWRELPAKTEGLLEDFRDVFSAKSHWKNLKTTIRKSTRPYFPCIALFMNDLKHLEDLPMVKDGLIHYYRCVAQQSLITMLLEGGRALVDKLVPNYDIQAAFAFWRVVSDDTLKDMSLDIQPK